MADADYAIVSNGVAIGTCKGFLVAKRILEKMSTDLMAKDKTLYLRVENGGATNRLVYPPSIAFKEQVVHVIHATILKKLRDPAASEDNKTDV